MSTIDAKTAILVGDSVHTIKEKLLTLYHQTIENSIRLLDEEMLEHLADLLTAADKILFFGQAGSGASAHLGESLFLQVGMPAVAYTDISLGPLAASQLRQNDIAIGLSSSGCAKTPVDSLRVAKAKGATTIGITGFANSPLAEQSDVLICYDLFLEDLRLAHVDRLCETAVLGVIQNCILSKNYETMAKGMQASKNAFMGTRY